MKYLMILVITMMTTAAHATDYENRRTVSVNGYGEVKVEADMAVVDLSVRSVRKSGKEAKKEVDDRVNNFLAELKTMGIKPKDIIASTLHIFPRYEHINSSRHFSGYEANRSIEVTIRDLKHLTHIMDKALEQKLEGIDNIRFENSKMPKHVLKAHKLAIADSKQKAKQLAKAYGAQLGPIVRIDYHRNAPIYGTSQGDSAEMYASAPMSRSMKSSPGTYTAGEISYTDNISVIFDLIVSP